MNIFEKMHVLKIQKKNSSRTDAPAGASHPSFTFSEITWRVEKINIRY